MLTKPWMVSGALAGSLALVSWAMPASAQADSDAGRTVFTQKCAACHTIEADGAHHLLGPNLRGVVGRTAGTVAGWDFSAALQASKVVWNEENLNTWLTDPEAFASGTPMAVKMPDRFEREDVIAYLQSVAKESSEGAPAAAGQ